MGQQQQELRRAAAEAFAESLEQLQQTFVPEDKAAMTPIDPIDQHKPDQPEALADQSSHGTFGGFDLSSFEEAIADLEQFIEQRRDLAQ